MIAKAELITTPATRKQILYLYALTKDIHYLDMELTMEEVGRLIGIERGKRNGTCLV